MEYQIRMLFLLFLAQLVYMVLDVLCSIGETFLVSGLGIIGLLTCQILIANGCKVLGFILTRLNVK